MQTIKAFYQQTRPVTTLFLLMSLDGKISTGADDDRDFDKDLPKIYGPREGLHQYYEIEQMTDLWSLCSGRVQAKIGANESPLERSAVIGITFVVIDNHHLTRHGVEYLCSKYHRVMFVTVNSKHPAFLVTIPNLQVLYYERFQVSRMMEDLYQKFGCDRLTIQTKGSLNSQFLREKVIDYVDVVVAPILVGGKDTSTLIDGESAITLEELGVLQLLKATPLQNSYLRLQYKVIS